MPTWTVQPRYKMTQFLSSLHDAGRFWVPLSIGALIGFVILFNILTWFFHAVLGGTRCTRLIAIYLDDVIGSFRVHNHPPAHALMVRLQRWTCA